MSDIAKQYAGLPPEKRALFKKLLLSRGINPDTLILPEDRSVNAFPLSFAQQRMWFLHQLDPDSPYYNIPSLYRMSGALDLARLQNCLGEIIRRHETLRTVFREENGEPAQVVLAEIPLPFQLVDLRGLPPEQREETVLRQAQAEALRPFDLARGPLVRVILWQLAGDDCIASAALSTRLMSSRLNCSGSMFTGGRSAARRR